MKKIKNQSNHQTHIRQKPNQTHQIHMKPKPNQNHQTDQPIKRKSYPSPISTSPSTTEFSYQTYCRSTYQTHRWLAHPPPLSSQIKKLKHYIFIRPNSMGERERKLHLVHIEEREREWFRSRDHASHLFFQLVLGTPLHWTS